MQSNNLVKIPVPGFRNMYFADSEGNIISAQRNKERKLIGGIDKDGYRKLILCIGGKGHYFRVSCLVALCFLGERPKGMVVRHIDGNMNNNRPSNLAYGTQKENIQDKEIHGTKRFGENHISAKVTEKDVVDIRNSNLSSAKLALVYGMSRSGIDCIKSRRTWGHVL